MGKYYSSSTGLLDRNGNLIGYAKRNYVIETSDHFSYLYENEWMDWIKKTTGVSTPKVFFALTSLLEPGSPVIDLSPLQRRRITSEYGISSTSLYSALNELEDEGVILRGDVVNDQWGDVVHSFQRGEIMINPLVAWKGKASDRRAAIEKFLSYIKHRR